MKNFVQWVEDKGLSLDIPQKEEINTDAEGEKTDSPKGKTATKEDRTRTGLSANYPDAYVRSQYPHKYFNPALSTADLDDPRVNKKAAK